MHQRNMNLPKTENPITLITVQLDEAPGDQGLGLASLLGMPLGILSDPEYETAVHTTIIKGTP